MLEVEDLHAYYGKSHILQGVDMHIGAGEVVSLLGRNGVGRSTTVKAIMGEVPPQGSILFKGGDIAGLAELPDRASRASATCPRTSRHLSRPDRAAEPDARHQGYQRAPASGGSRTCWRCSRTSPRAPTPRPACCPAASSRC